MSIVWPSLSKISRHSNQYNQKIQHHINFINTMYNIYQIKISNPKTFLQFTHGFPEPYCSGLEQRAKFFWTTRYHVELFELYVVHIKNLTRPDTQTGWSRGGWAGAIVPHAWQLQSRFIGQERWWKNRSQYTENAEKGNGGPTDRPTDRQTDRPTDRPTQWLIESRSPRLKKNVG